MPLTSFNIFQLFLDGSRIVLIEETEFQHLSAAFWLLLIFWGILGLSGEQQEFWNLSISHLLQKQEEKFSRDYWYWGKVTYWPGEWGGDPYSVRHAWLGYHQWNCDSVARMGQNVGSKLSNEKRIDSEGNLPATAKRGEPPTKNAHLFALLATELYLLITKRMRCFPTHRREAFGLHYKSTLHTFVTCEWSRALSFRICKLGGSWYICSNNFTLY